MGCVDDRKRIICGIRLCVSCLNVSYIGIIVVCPLLFIRLSSLDFLFPKCIPYGMLYIYVTLGFDNMSTKTQTSLRLDQEKLAEAKQILADLGLNFSEAVNIFTNLIVAKQGLPFNVTLPNKETQIAMQDVRARKNLETSTLKQLKRELSKE